MFRIWEENRGRLKGVTKRSDERRRKIAARLKEVPDLDRWRAAIQRFARGWAGKQSWATLDFLIKSEANFLKVEEGTYDEATSGESRVAVPRRTSSRMPDEWDLAGEEPLTETTPRETPQ